jgi:hypothetical protein
MQAARASAHECERPPPIPVTSTSGGRYRLRCTAAESARDPVAARCRPGDRGLGKMAAWNVCLESVGTSSGLLTRRP